MGRRKSFVRQEATKQLSSEDGALNVVTSSIEQTLQMAMGKSNAK